jgi:RNA polymerase sigma-70 factor (ECF subfamily)
MDAGRPRFEADRRERDALAGRFLDAFRDGDVDGLRELLAADVRLDGDGGGKAPQFAGTITGPDRVVELLGGAFGPMARAGVTLSRTEVNGQPGALLLDRDGRVFVALSLDVADGRIQAIRSVINPDKLRHLGPVADAWALAREVGRFRVTD